MNNVALALAAMPSAAPDAGVAGRAEVLAAAAPLLAEVKRENRAAYAALAEQRVAVGAAQRDVDVAAAALAAMQYERAQLEHAISACEERTPVYERVPLRSEDEFRAAVPDAATDGGAHAYMLRRLQHELDEKRRYVTGRARRLMQHGSALQSARSRGGRAPAAE